MKHRSFDIPFHRTQITGREILHLQALLNSGELRSDGRYASICEEMISTGLSVRHCLLTTSGTHALEIAALLLDLEPGDEVVLPAFTHYSTANPFLLRGATVVCTDIDPLTLNIDIIKTRAAFGPRTRAVVPVHYAGTSCPIDDLTAAASSRGITVIEDNALGFRAEFKGRSLGSCGTIGCLSFHSGKNITSGGEGGALLTNDDRLAERAALIREMGTNRREYLDGKVSSYTWLAAGSSYLMNELSAAFLLAQLEAEAELRRERLSLWNQYHTLLAPLEDAGLLLRPHIPSFSTHNGHTYYIRTAERSNLQAWLAGQGIESAAHYPSLPDTPFGQKSDRVITLEPPVIARRTASELLRLPLHPGMTEFHIESVCRSLRAFFAQASRSYRSADNPGSHRIQD